ncbi:MAG: hypothetical protein EBZ95_14820 [Chitinophagia bacterium]|nr:hypothetical protein [Chitinophagia bacterium]
MKYKLAYFCTLLTAVLFTSVFAQRVPDDASPNGIQNFCAAENCVAGLWMYKRLYKTEPSQLPYNFIQSNDLNFSERLLVNKANALFQSNPIISMMLIEKNKIIFEKYKEPINSSTALAGFSMTKTVTSMTVGQAICSDSGIKLESKGNELNKNLIGTAQGNSTIQQLLTMTSGGLRGTLSMGAWPKNGGQIGSTSYRGYKNIPILIKDYGQREASLEKLDEYLKPGEEFSYKNTDTIALSLALSGENPQKFNEYFNEKLAPLIGFENPVYWVHDENGYTYTSTSFHATMKDWGRLAQFVLNKLNDLEKSCYSNYIKAAATTQVKNYSNRHGKDFYSGEGFGGYGYGFWTENKMKSNAIYLVGARGQRIAIDKNGQKIMIIFSTDEKDLGSIYSFFNSW